MKKKMSMYGVLLISALLILQIPVPESDAASEFQISGSTLVKYTGTAETVSVPTSVAAIGRGVFEGNTHITKVVLPRTVTDIEEYAFWGCSNLETVELGRGLTEISDYSFANCTGLKEMTLTSNIQSIGIRAFMDCANMTSIIIPPEVTDIHDTSFDGCVKLTIMYTEGSYAEEYAENFLIKQAEMTVYEDMEEKNSREENISREEENSRTEVQDANKDGTAGGSHDLSQTSGSGSILGSTHVVGNRAVVFVDNTKLAVNGGSTGVNEGSTWANGESSRPGDGILENLVAVPDGELPKFAIVNRTIVADQAYYGNQEMTAVSLPEGIREIGQFSFARSSLLQAVIPQGTQTIGYGAFYHCDNLSAVSLPETIMNVEPKAFSHTLWMEQFLKNGTGDFMISGGVLAAYRGNNSNPVIPEGVRVIAAEAFAGHHEITGISLPDSLLVIGEGAFEGCDNLTQVTGGANVIRIKDRAFGGCPLKTVEIVDSVEEIGLGAFNGAESIVFHGKEIPRLSYEASAQRLSNGRYRIPALYDIPFAVIDSGITQAELEDTVLYSQTAPFLGIICSMGEDGKLHCRFSNLTEQELLQLTIPETVYINGNNYEVTDMDRIQSLPVERVQPSPGSILVTGIVEGVTASLEGADEDIKTSLGYELSFLAADTRQQMEEAYQRIYSAGLPEDTLVYEITLRDGETGVPVTGLGTLSMTITMPVPQGLQGNNIQVLTLDRNGQLEAVSADLIQDITGSYLTFTAKHFSMYGFYGKEE